MLTFFVQLYFVTSDLFGSREDLRTPIRDVGVGGVQTQHLHAPSLVAKELTTSLGCFKLSYSNLARTQQWGWEHGEQM